MLSAIIECHFEVLIGKLIRFFGIRLVFKLKHLKKKNIFDEVRNSNTRLKIVVDFFLFIHLNWSVSRLKMKYTSLQSIDCLIWFCVFGYLIHKHNAIDTWINGWKNACHSTCWNEIELRWKQSTECGSMFRLAVKITRLENRFAIYLLCRTNMFFFSMSKEIDVPYITISFEAIV